MAFPSNFRFFLPKETMEAIAKENAKLLFQAQSNIGLLGSQMAASEAGTKQQIQWYEMQQQQQQQQQQYHQSQPHPQHQHHQYQYQHQNQQQPQQHDQGHEYTYHQQNQRPLGYQHWQQDRQHQQYQYNGNDGMNESRSECIIS